MEDGGEDMVLTQKDIELLRRPPREVSPGSPLVLICRVTGTGVLLPDVSPVWCRPLSLPLPLPQNSLPE